MGPTAVGKTKVAIELANHFETEIISADSRQIFKELTIGSAKPSVSELNSVPQHFVNHISITEDYDASRFETEALELIDDLFKSHEAVVLVGGSGLYIKAVCQGFDEIPEVAKEIREELNRSYESEGISFLQDKLKIHDPDYYEIVDLNNPHRLIRALEVSISSGLPYSSYLDNDRNGTGNKRDFNITKIGLNLDRELLYERINQRVDEMVKNGLEAEARKYYGQRHINALQSVGYKELFEYFDGNITLQEAVETIKKNTRHYAKRQMTWFNKDDSIKWFKPDEVAEIISFVEEGPSLPVRLFGGKT
ncbi:MAG: tRNA (adenosine(37)-N6)-dimethylallyltransferase MiaA [Bacteroidetes bacterium]|nr:tRNA (adenosine(37)-N6)-dimethylallyltransferase MiaA [Bacteroidota bacterium]